MRSTSSRAPEPSVIEALSRGADRAVFVDRSFEASAAIYDNLGRAHLSERGAVHTKDVNAFLAGGPSGGHLDLVMLDPPCGSTGPDLARTLQELAPVAGRARVDGGCQPGWNEFPRLSFR